jgi:hypothetical protein
LHEHQQKSSVVAVYQDSTEGAQDQTRRRAAQTQHAQCHCGAGDLIGDPIKRHLLYEMAYGAQQIAGPEQCIIAVTQ